MGRMDKFDNLIFYDLDDFSIITRAKISSRHIEDLVTKYYIKKLNINTTHFSDLHGLSSFRLENNKVKKNDFIIHNHDENSRDLSDFFYNERLKYEKTLETIIKCEYNKPIIFFYRNPLNLITTGLWENISFINFQPISNFISFLEFFDKEKYNLLISILKKTQTQNKEESIEYLISNSYISFNEILDSKDELSVDEQKFIIDLIFTLIKNEININRLNNAHIGFWLSSVWKLVSNNKNINLINLDSDTFVDFVPLFNKYSQFDFPAIDKSVSKSNKKYYSLVDDFFNKNVLEKNIVNNLFSEEFKTYDIIKNDTRNLTK